jgi:hypothetical protein
MNGVNFTYPLYAFRSSGSKSDTYVRQDHEGGQIRVSDMLQPNSRFSVNPVVSQFSQPVKAGK